MKNVKRIIIIVIIACACLSACNKKESYFRIEYKSKEDVKKLYYDNKDLFDDVVRIIGGNDTFDRECRGFPHFEGSVDAATLPRPDCKNMRCFSDEEKVVLNRFFEFRPYNIYLKYQRRYLKISFMGEGYGEIFAFIFFINPDETVKIDVKEDLLRNNYDVEEVEDFLLAHFLQDITPTP